MFGSARERVDEGLRLHEVEDAVDAALARDPACLVAAEGEGGVEHLVAVDPDVAGLEPSLEAARPCDASRVGARREPVGAGVCGLDCFSFVLERSRQVTGPKISSLGCGLRPARRRGAPGS